MASVRDVTNNQGTGTANAVGNLPAGTVDGDFLLAAVSFRSGSAHDVVTPPAGWTLRDDRNVNAGNNRLKVYSKVASSEPGTWTWVFAGSGQFIVQVVGVESPDPTTPYNTGNGQTNASSVNVVAPSITTTKDGCILVYFGSTGTSPATFTAPGGMLEQEDANQGTNLTTTTATETQATQGATGTRTGVATVAAVNIGFLGAVAPADPTGVSLLVINP